MRQGRHPAKRPLLAALTALVLLPATFALAGPADALTGVSGLRVITSGAKAPSYASMWMQWTWSPRPRKYVLQVSSDRFFTRDVRTKTVLRAPTRPAGGVQRVQVRSLPDATKHYVRIRATDGILGGPWSGFHVGSTRAYYPAPVTGVVATPGPGVGEATLSWSTTGANTTGFRLVTSLTAYAKGGTGRSRHTTTFPAKARSHTFTAAEMRRLGAPLESGNFLFGQLYVYNQGNGSRSETMVDGWQTLMPLGRAATGTGDPLVLASYNVRTFSATPNNGRYSWNSREPHVVDNILAADPDVITLQEVSPADMGNGVTQDESLLAALQEAEPADRDYVYGRSTPFTWDGSTVTGGTQAQRIIYDAHKYEQVGADCYDERNQGACAFDTGGGRWATYLHLAPVDDASRSFWVVAAHLNAGRTAASEVTRANQVRKINAKMDVHAGTGPDADPVVLGMDSNTWQTYPYGPTLSRDALLGAGYYDTSACAAVPDRLDNYKYSTDNTKGYGSTGVEKATKGGYGPRLDVIAVKNLPGADDFRIDAHPGVAFPGSDHNLVRAVIRLP
ncbi:MAG: Endonuclease/Exonuclease/phosphatase family protein [Marmoricola sp.]|nr:Endonuclease/Exonuclease/phosphatase family protein [Marmoricola sp.]